MISWQTEGLLVIVGFIIIYSTLMTMVQRAMGRTGIRSGGLFSALWSRAAAAFGVHVYMIDYSVFNHPDSWLRSTQEMAEHARKNKIASEEAIAAQGYLQKNGETGVGDITAYPPGLLSTPLDDGMASSVEEAQIILFDVVEKALEAAKVHPSEVDFIVTASTTFSTIPSLSAMVMNHFKMRGDVRNYSLSSKGCTMGAIMVELAQTLCKHYPGSVCLIIAHENMTSGGFYTGNNPSYMVPSLLFRTGGAAAVFSSRPRDRGHAKYRLLYTVRTNTCFDDDAHNSIRKVDVGGGQTALAIDKTAIEIGGVAAISANLRRLAPLVLPLPLLVKAVIMGETKKMVKNFTTAFDHVCIHPGAKHMVDKIRKALMFGESAAVSSYQTLNRFGSTASASTFYVLAHKESFVGVKKGDRVLQLCFGSGAKCCTAVYVALRENCAMHPAWEKRAKFPNLQGSAP